jgi:hypothetical protein
MEVVLSIPTATAVLVAWTTVSLSGTRDRKMVTMMEWETRVTTAVKSPTRVKRTLSGMDCCVDACSDADTDSKIPSMIYALKRPYSLYLYHTILASK